MRNHPAITRLTACAFLSASASVATAAEALRQAPAEKVAAWKITQPITWMSQYTGLAVGLDGRMWVSDLWDREILVFDSFQKFTTLSTGSFAPVQMTRGWDGYLYANEGTTDILKVSPTGSMTTISVGQITYNGISVGPDGSVWVPEQSQVGRIFADGTVREYPAISGDMVQAGTSIVQAADGDVWYDAYTPGGPQYLASMSAYTGAIRKHCVDACGTENALPIVAGADGRVWSVHGDSIYGYDHAGGVTKVSWPGQLHFAMVGGYNNAVSGPDNAIWIVGQNVQNGLNVGGAIVRFDLVSHTFHKYVAPRGYEWANGLAFDPHGNIWAGANNGTVMQLVLR